MPNARTAGVSRCHDEGVSFDINFYFLRLTITSEANILLISGNSGKLLAPALLLSSVVQIASLPLLSIFKVKHSCCSQGHHVPQCSLVSVYFPLYNAVYLCGLYFYSFLLITQRIYLIVCSIPFSLPHVQRLTYRHCADEYALAALQASLQPPLSAPV